MRAEVLRRASALMRDRAEAATYTLMPWDVDEIGAVWAQEADGQPIPIARRSTDADAAHIASWHPAVALAVADWLDTAGADLWAHGPLCECGSGCHDCDDDLWQSHVRRALAVARAYLGETA